MHDDAVVAPPAHAPGVKCAEAALRGTSKCIFCGVAIPKNSIRFSYFPSLHVERFMHATCFDHVPIPLLAHSRATLTYQLDHGCVGPHGVALDAAIRAALD